MSIKVVSWALNDAPVDQPVQVLILVAMAERCNEDGTETYQSARTIATKARISPRTVQRELKTLEMLGVIRRGDQGAASHLPVNRRPVVYDLAVEKSRGDNLSYQDSDTTQFASDTTSVQVRYDNDDTLDTTPMADNTSFITSPLTSPSELPPWLPEDRARSAQELLEKEGFTLENVIERYLNCGYFTSEKPNAERFGSWVNLEVQSKRMGKELKLKTVTMDTPDDVEKAFQMFWDAYPKKERMTSARAAFKAVATKDNALTIIQKAKGYARSVTASQTEPRFITAPANWLIDKRWTDEYPSALNSLTRTAADY